MKCEDKEKKRKEKRKRGRAEEEKKAIQQANVEAEREDIMKWSRGETILIQEMHKITHKTMIFTVSS